jgi:hypothetical protein
MIYIFSSNSRPLYLQNAFSTLASPTGMIMQYRYDQSIVDPDLFGEADNLSSQRALIGRDVLVSFITQPKTKPIPFSEISFYPLRRGRVSEITIRGRTLYISVKLLEYAKWDDHLEKLSSQEISNLYLALLGQEKCPPIKYASFGAEPQNNALPFAKPNEQIRAWQSAVVKISQNRLFSNAVFFRVSGIKRVDQTIHSKLRRTFWPSSDPIYNYKDIPMISIFANQAGYELESSKTYMLYLDFFHSSEPQQTAYTRSVILGIDSPYFMHIPKPIPIHFRYDNVPVPLLVTSVNREVITGLDIEIQEIGQRRPTDLKSPLDNQLVIGPKINFLIRLTYSRFRFIFQGSILLIAQLAIALTGRVAAILTGLKAPQALIDFAPTLDLLFLIFGPILTTITFISLFRRLPGFAET